MREQEYKQNKQPRKRKYYIVGVIFQTKIKPRETSLGYGASSHFYEQRRKTQQDNCHWLLH